MAPRVIEKLSVPKTGDDSLNEDAYMITDTIVAVFDGETDKREGIRIDPSPGRIAACVLAEAAVEMPDECDPTIAIKFLCEAIASVSTPDVEPVAVGAILNLSSRYLIRVGDISIGINGIFHFSHKRIDEIAGQARAALLISELRAGVTMDYLRSADPGREMILPLLRAANKWRNQSDSEFGFGAFDGRDIPIEFIDVFEIPSGSDVILASDGYDNPQPTLSESEKLLAESIKHDPLRLGPPPGTKGVHVDNCSFDDRTYVRVKL